jgi:hypothetical protein
VIIGGGIITKREPPQFQLENTHAEGCLGTTAVSKLCLSASCAFRGRKSTNNFKRKRRFLNEKFGGLAFCLEATKSDKNGAADSL